MWIRKNRCVVFSASLRSSQASMCTKERHERKVISPASAGSQRKSIQDVALTWPFVSRAVVSRRFPSLLRGRRRLRSMQERRCSWWMPARTHARSRSCPVFWYRPRLKRGPLRPYIPGLTGARRRDNIRTRWSGTRGTQLRRHHQTACTEGANMLLQGTAFYVQSELLPRRSDLLRHT